MISIDVQYTKEIFLKIPMIGTYFTFTKWKILHTVQVTSPMTFNHRRNILIKERMTIMMYTPVNYDLSNDVSPSFI